MRRLAKVFRPSRLSSHDRFGLLKAQALPAWAENQEIKGGLMIRTMIRTSCCITAAVLGVLATQATAQVSDFRPVTDAVLANPDNADWLMLNRTYDEQRFSPLNQINKGNVGQLRMAWSRGLPPGTQE